ncbi:MAG: DMT family transporter [Rhodospirillales bacterium]|nr:DMT family transporter [Rhodospirillales bacterium]
MGKFYHYWLTLPGNVRGSLLALVASLLAVQMASLIKHVGQTVPVVEILFIRQVLVVLIISPVILKNLDTVFMTNLLRFHLLRSTLSVIAMVTGFVAVVHMPLAEVTAISFVRTLFTTILAIIFLKEAVGFRRWSSVVVGFIGVLVIVRPDAQNINTYALLAITSAFFVSSINIVMRKLSQIENPSTIMAYQSIFVTLVLAGPAAYLWVTPTVQEMILIVAIGCVMSLMQWIFIQAFKAGEAAAIAPMEYSRLLYATIIGIVFFAEIPTAWTFGGASIIIASTLYTMHRNALKKDEKVPDGS